MTHAEPQIRLNASALSDPSALHLRLYSDSVSVLFTALVDSGSLHCFVNSDFVVDHGVRTTPISLIQLSLFDGSSNTLITEKTTMPIHFPSGEVLDLDFYITLLDKSVSAVLGYSWLSAYNSGIDWKMHSIHFRNTPMDRPVTPLTSPPLGPTTLPDPVSLDPPPIPSVSLIGAAAFARALSHPVLNP